MWVYLPSVSVILKPNDFIIIAMHPYPKRSLSEILLIVSQQ